MRIVMTVRGITCQVNVKVLEVVADEPKEMAREKPGSRADYLLGLIL
jgi:putative heme iron utilization protein